jgi:arylformamidase
MKVRDISVTVSPELPVWPGDPEIVLERYTSIAGGDQVNASRIACSVHVGTHVDAPVHFVDGGRGVDELALDALVGDAFVADARGLATITADALNALDVPPGTKRLLLRTDNSGLWSTGRFEPGFAALDAGGARWIVGRELALVGIDYLSVQRYDDPTADTHRIMLEAGVVLLEGLNLGDVDPGGYMLVCLPVKLRGADGAPARAVLLE